MGDDPRPPELSGRWVHSFEEDDGTQRVYRRPGWTFPRARGRGWLALEADGTAEVGGPGADDRGASEPGSWSVDDGVVSVERAGRTARFRVLLVDDDRLVVRPEQG